MTLDNDSWSQYFDSLADCAARLKAAVTLARVPLLPARAERDSAPGAKGGLLETIRFDRERDEIVIAICQNGAAGATIRYFVAAPRSVAVESYSLSEVISITDAEGICTLVSVVNLDGELDECLRATATGTAG